MSVVPIDFQGGVNNFDVGVNHRRSQYEANRGTRLGKILSNTVDFFFLSD